MRGYETAIIEATGCGPEDAELIEDIMRNEVFHSTLDWQTREQFSVGARQAAQILSENREMFEGHRSRVQALFQQGE